MPERTITAAELVGAMNDAGGDALLAVAQIIKQMVIADLPVGDPDRDPDPAVALADNIVIRRYGNVVSISVETDYAVKLHESLQFRHPRGGKAKFLERNVAAATKLLEAELARRVQVAMQTQEFTTGRTRQWSSGDRPMEIT